MNRVAFSLIVAGALPLFLAACDRPDVEDDAHLARRTVDSLRSLPDVGDSAAASVREAARLTRQGDSLLSAGDRSMAHRSFAQALIAARLAELTRETSAAAHADSALTDAGTDTTR